jgi:branched-chain amino acid transport system permease protein
MPQDLYILAILDGLSYAALLFLVALGMTLVFGVMNIVNMAHGSFYALGGYMAATLGIWATSQGLSPAWSLLILPLAAVIIGVVFGGLMETSLMQRIYSKDPILQLLVTFSAFMIFEDFQSLFQRLPFVHHILLLILNHQHTVHLKEQELLSVA